MPNLVDTALVLWRRSFKITSMYFFIFIIFSPLEKGVALDLNFDLKNPDQSMCQVRLSLTQ